jgi:hypothetical protein
VGSPAPGVNRKVGTLHAGFRPRHGSTVLSVHCRWSPVPAPPSVSSLSAGCTADCPILKMLPPPVTRLRTRQQTAGQTDFGGAVGWWVPPPLGSTEKLGRSTLGSDRGTAQRFYPYTAAGRPSLLHHLFLLSLLGALPIARF